MMIKVNPLHLLKKKLNPLQREHHEEEDRGRDETGSTTQGNNLL
jgi:hypothetical protein